MKVFIAYISSVDRCRVNLNIANINKCCTGKVVWASLPIHKCSVIVHLEITWLTRTGRSNFMCSARDEFYRNKITLFIGVFYVANFQGVTRGRLHIVNTCPYIGVFHVLWHVSWTRVLHACTSPFFNVIFTCQYSRCKTRVSNKIFSRGQLHVTNTCPNVGVFHVINATCCSVDSDTCLGHVFYTHVRVLF